MNQMPCLLAQEFSTRRVTGGSHYSVYEHPLPKFGQWIEKIIDLGHLKISLHEAEMSSATKILFNNKASSKNYVHHNMSLSGCMRIKFLEDGPELECKHLTYHSLYVPLNDHYIVIDPHVKTVHLEIDTDQYVRLLPDSEQWCVNLKERLLQHRCHVTHPASITPVMLHAVKTIFDAPVVASLSKLFIESKIHELLAVQWNGIIHSDAGQLRKDNRELFEAIRSFLNQSFLEELSLRGIAMQFGINEFKLKRDFRAYFNSSVFDYVLAKHLEYSLLLLQDTTQSIKEIGTKIGYKYPNHFSTAFKNYFGHNPIEMRRYPIDSVEMSQFNP